MVPYYDVENKRYAVTVTLRYETAGQNFRRAYPREYVDEGVKQILSHFDKDYSGKNPDELGTALDFFVPERPREKVKVSVGIDEDVFENLNNTTFSSTMNQVADEISLNTYNLSKKINGVVKILNNFHETIKNLDAKIYGINLSEEADLLSYLGGSLTNLAEKNGYQVLETKSDLLSIGVDSNYFPSYVQYNDGTGFKNLTSEFTAFKNSQPGKNNQSFYFLKKIDDIYVDNKRSPSIKWDDFLKKYTIKEYRIEFGETRPYSNPKDPSKQKIIDESNRKSIKSPEELERENRKLKNEKFKKEIADEQERLVKKIEGGPLGNLKKVEGVLAYPQKTINDNLKKVGINGVYYEFFHKYNLQQLIKQAIICLDPNGVIARTYQAAKDFLRMGVRFLEDLVAILKIPVITLDDLIPTVDILSDIGKQIYLAVMAALKEALVQMLIDVINMIVYACGNPDDMNFGALNIGDLFSDPTNLENWTKFGQEVGSRTLNATVGGITSGINNFSNLEFEASKEYIKNIQGFLSNETVERLTAEGVFADGPGSVRQLMREVSSVLTPGETSELLLRGGTTTTRTMVQNIVDNSSAYPQSLKSLLSDQNKISDLFTSAGKLINEEKLLEKVEEARNLLPSEFDGLCSDDPNEQLRRNLLQGKGLTEDEITSQIEKARERRLKRLQQLQEMLEKDNLLDGAIPPLYCSVDSNGNIKPGLIEIDHPAFTFSLKRTLNSSFDSIYTSFNTDAENFIPSMKKERKVGEKEIKRAFKKTGQDLAKVRDYNDSLGDDEAKLPEAYINPEFETFYASGLRPPTTHPNLGNYPGPLIFPTPYSIRLEGLTEQNPNVTTRQLSPDPDIEFFIQDKYGPAASIFVNENKFLIAPGLRDSLREIANPKNSTTSFSELESDETLGFPNFKIEKGFVYLSFESILVQDLSFYSPAGSSGVSLKKQLENLTSAGSFGPSRFFIEYQSNGAVVGNPTEDYEISFYTLGERGRRETQKFSISEVINPQVINLIKNENLYTPSLTLNTAISSYDQFAYTTNTSPSDLQGAQIAQELQFSQLLQKTVSGGSIVRDSLDLENKEQIGGIVNFPMLTNLLLPQKISGEIQSLYIEIYRDFLTAFSSEIANSDLFEEGVLDLANFSPKLTKQQVEQGCQDPHLLNLDSIREIVLNEYQTTKCIDNVISKEDGSGNKDGALEKSLVGGAVVLTIRFYVIEMFLKTIFAFSQFNFTNQSEIPALATRIIYEKMINEISNLGYSSEFTSSAINSYNKLAIINQDLNQTTSGKEALEFLIRREIMVVQDKINLILGTDENLKIESVVSEGFMNFYDVPSGSNEIRFSDDKIRAINEKAEFERQLLNRGLSEEAILKRERMQTPGSYYTYRSIISVLEKELQENDNKPVLSEQFKFLPLFTREWVSSATFNQAIDLTTRNLLPNWMPHPGMVQGTGNSRDNPVIRYNQFNGSNERPDDYNLGPIKGTSGYYAGNAGLATGGKGGGFGFIDKPLETENQPATVVGGGLTYYNIDASFEDLSELNDAGIVNSNGSPFNAWQKTNNNAIGWEEIVDNPQETDSTGILTNQPPQFILELWPLFTFALAVEPNQKVVNYKQITPKFGFNEQTKESMTPNKTGYNQLYNPSITEQENGFSQRWENNGLNNTTNPDESYWDGDTTIFERDAMLTMFEMFNNFNLLLPGSAGASFTVPTGNNFRWNAGTSENGNPGSGFQSRPDVWINEMMYELVDLPSPNIVHQCYEPVLMNTRYHDLNWQLNVPRPADTRSWKTRQDGWYAGSLYRNSEDGENEYRIDSNYEGFNGCLYRNYVVDDMPIPLNDFAFNSGVEGRDGFLCEYSFHPKMTHYSIQDATINDFPEDIRKEINYYQSWSSMDDRYLLRFLRRQFISNRTHFKLSYNENQRLEKIGTELRLGRWQGRPLPEPEVFERIINKINSGFLGNRHPDIDDDVSGYEMYETLQAGSSLNPADATLASNQNIANDYVGVDAQDSSWVAAQLGLFSNSGQTRPRGFQGGLGLRGDVSKVNPDFKGYTLIYILDQIRNRLDNFQNKAAEKIDDDPFTGFIYAPVSYNTFDEPDNTLRDESDWPWYDNPRRDSSGWVPGAGSPNTAWPPKLNPFWERSKPRIQYTDTTFTLDSHRYCTINTEYRGQYTKEYSKYEFADLFGYGAGGFAGTLTNDQRQDYTGIYKEVSYVYDSSDGITKRVATNTNDYDIQVFKDTLFYPNNAVIPNRPRDGSNSFRTPKLQAAFNLTYLQLWEFDWWMSKLTAFMLLEPSFEPYRSIKDYPGFLKDYRAAAEHVKSQFNRDLEFRKNERKRILEEVGDVFNSRQPSGNILTKFMDNGGLVYEKYIRLKEHDWDELEAQATPAQLTQIQNLRAIVENNRDGWLKGAVNVDAFQNWLQQYYYDLNAEYDEAKEMVDEAFPEFEQTAIALARDCGGDLVVGEIRDVDEVFISRQDFANLSLDDLFEEARFGLRITAVSAPNSEILIQAFDQFEGTGRFNGIVTNLGMDENGNQTFFTKTFEEAIRNDKAYLLRESETITQDIGENIEITQIEDLYTTIPIISVESEINKNLPLTDFIGNKTIAEQFDSNKAITMKKMRYLYNQKMPELLNSLKETDEFKFLFNYCFPVERMFSLNLAYILSYLGQIQDVDRNFSNTKQNLKVVFNAFLNAGNYRYEHDINNRGLANYDPSNPNDPNQTPGVDLSSIAKNFAFMVFKSYTEMTDLNIKVSNLVFQTANQAIKAVNNVFGIECPVISELPPETLIGISAGLSFTPGIGPPKAAGYVYLPIFGTQLNPFLPESSKNSYRCDLKDTPGGRDFTRANQCNSEDGVTPLQLPSTTQDTSQTPTTNGQTSTTNGQGQTSSTETVINPNASPFDVSYIDELGRKRNSFGQVIGDDGKLYDLDGKEIDTSVFNT
jgi:hypothetical protein